MGCIQSGEAASPEARAEKEKDKSLAAELARDKSKDSKTWKLLLLGAGNSGKSTFQKQLCQIHKNTISGNPRSIHDSVLNQMKTIIESAKDQNFELDQKTQPSADFIENLSKDTKITSFAPFFFV